MKSYKNLKLKVITLFKENDFIVTKLEEKNISISLKRSKKKEELIFKAINTRVQNLLKKSEQEKSKFSVSEFIDFISKNTPQNLQEKEAKRKLKEQIKLRRETWNCFYTEQEIKHFYNQLQSIAFHAKMIKFTNDEKIAIVKELQICSLPMSIIFARTINRLKQLVKERQTHIKLAHYLSRLDKQNTKPYTPIRDEVQITIIEVDNLVKKFFKEYFPPKSEV